MRFVDLLLLLIIFILAVSAVVYFMFSTMATETTRKDTLDDLTNYINSEENVNDYNYKTSLTELQLPKIEGASLKVVPVNSGNSSYDFYIKEEVTNEVVYLVDVGIAGFFMSKGLVDINFIKVNSQEDLGTLGVN